LTTNILGTDQHIEY